MSEGDYRYSVRALFGTLGDLWSRHKPQVILICMIIASIVGLVLVHRTESESLLFFVTRDLLAAVLVASSAGIVYEAMARSRAEEMIQRAISADEDRRRKEIGDMIAEAITKYTGLYDSGLTTFHHSRDYFHKALSDLPPATQRVRVLAVHGMRVWKNAEFISGLASNASVCIQTLLLDPTCTEALEARASESPEDLSVESTRADINAALRHVCHLGLHCPNTQVRLFRCSPSFSMVVLDDMLYLTGYLKGCTSQHSPTCTIERRRSHGLYELFDDYFTRMWHEASPIDPGSYVGIEGDTG